jgi:RNA 3'-terminal phosphate cyclase (ATP)
MGPRVRLVLERHGFFPAGNGRLWAEITPSRQLGSLHLWDADPLVARHVRAVVARLPEHIGRRECRRIAEHLGWDEECCSVETVHNSAGPGNVVMVSLSRPQVTEMFTGFGQRGVPAERVADDVVHQVRRYLNAAVPVGEYLADQLLLPLALAAHAGTGGGAFRTLALSQHARTQLAVIQEFLDVSLTVEQRGEDDVVVSIARRTTAYS